MLAEHRIELEQSIVGFFLRNPRTLLTDGIQLKPEYFGSKENREVYRAIRQLSEEKELFGIRDVHEQLRKNQTLGKIPEVHELAAWCPHQAPELSDRPRQLIEENQRVYFVETLKQTLQTLDSRPDLSVLEIKTTLENKLDEKINPDNLKTEREFGKIVSDEVNKFAKLRENPKEYQGMSTGFIDLDRLTGGLKPGQLIIVAARPSMGKSTFVMNLALNFIEKENKPVKIFSIEMEAEEVVDRMLATKGRIALTAMQNGKLVKGDWDKLTEAMKIGTWPISINDQSTIDFSTVRQEARLMKKTTGLGLIIIDYLQLMVSEEKRDLNREREVAILSASLKRLAKDLRVPIIAVCQLNRMVETRNEKRPGLSDLRESGAIEQDADLVLMLYRDEYYHKASKDKGLMEVLVRKHRSGAVGDVILNFNPEMQCISDHSGMKL